MPEAGRAAPSPSRAQRLRSPLVLAGLAVVGCAALAVRDPGEPGFYPTCPTKALFGIDCPFCGGLRCTRALLTGDLSRALDQNLLVVVLAPVAVALWAVWMWSAWTGRPIPRPGWGPGVTRAVTVLAVVALLAWTVLRNVPAGAYLASGVG